MTVSESRKKQKPCFLLFCDEQFPSNCAETSKARNARLSEGSVLRTYVTEENASVTPHCEVYPQFASFLLRSKGGKRARFLGYASLRSK